MSKHEHIYRNGIDNNGKYRVCECGYKIRKTLVMTTPNTESDKSIDEILDRIWWHGESYGTGLVDYEDGGKKENMESAKSQLLAEILKGTYTFTQRWGDGSGEDTLEAVPVQYLKELFKEIE